MAAEAFDAHFAIPARLHDLRQPIGIILVALVYLCTHRRFRVAGIKTHHRKAHRFQGMPMPRAEWATFKPNPNNTSCFGFNRCCNVVRRRAALPSPDSLSVAADDAQVSQFLRHIQTNKLVHDGPPMRIIAGESLSRPAITPCRSRARRWRRYARAPSAALFTGRGAGELARGPALQRSLMRPCLRFWG